MNQKNKSFQEIWKQYPLFVRVIIDTGGIIFSLLLMCAVLTVAQLYDWEVLLTFPWLYMVIVLFCLSTLHEIIINQ